MTKGIYVSVGNGGGTVWVEYSADKDYDEQGDFWDIDWFVTKVYFKDLDITDILCDSQWKTIENAIHEDLNK